MQILISILSDFYMSLTVVNLISISIRKDIVIAVWERQKHN